MTQQIDWKRSLVQKKVVGFLTTSALSLLLTQATYSRENPVPQQTVVYENQVLGVRLNHPTNLRVVEDKYLSTSLGFTLVDPNGEGHLVGSPKEEHLVMRVSSMLNSSPEDTEKAVQKLVRAFPDVAIQQGTLNIDGQTAKVLYPVPGEDVSTYIYLEKNGRIYEIIYQGKLDDEGRNILSELRFENPRKSVESLGLPPQTEPALYVEQPSRENYNTSPSDKTEAVNKSVSMKPLVSDIKMPAQIGTLFEFGKALSLPTNLPTQLENREFKLAAIAGCVDWPTSKFIQTPWSNTANGSGSPYGISQGWSKAGPAHYGQNKHIRCNTAGYLNDYYALDFPLKKGDIVYPPASGKVIYAGWAAWGWRTMGRTVVVDLGDGYWSVAAHLSSINVYKGQSVGISTVIGRAGDSGYIEGVGYSDGAPTNGVHLHQGVYKNAQLAYDSKGYAGIHSGQSVQIRNVRYFGNGSGYYGTISNQQSMSW